MTTVTLTTKEDMTMHQEEAGVEVDQVVIEEEEEVTEAEVEQEEGGELEV